MRQEFSKSVRLAAWNRCGGLCEKCSVKLFPGKYEFHHDKECAFDGQPILENCLVLCIACHDHISGQRISVIAKNNRVRNKHLGIKRKKRTIGGRKFNGDPIFPRWK